MIKTDKAIIIDSGIVPGLWFIQVWVRESKNPIPHLPMPIVLFFLQSTYSGENTACGWRPSSTLTQLGQRSRQGGHAGSEPLHLFCT